MPNETHTPYNFVPFGNRVLLPYENINDLPGHDEIRPDLKSGEITVSLVAETPVFVSDGDKDEPHFFKGANGKYMIPGSTVRGMLRENVQILGYGLVVPDEDIEDYQIYYRDMASARNSLGYNVREHYKSRSALDVETTTINRYNPTTGRNDRISYSVPKVVKSGYIKNENGKYKIYPTKADYFKVSRNHADVIALEVLVGACDARDIKVDYTYTGDTVTNIWQRGSGDPGAEHGFLHYTGRPVGRMPNHLYLFPEADRAAFVKVPSQDVLSYQIDYENRENALRGGKRTSVGGTTRSDEDWLRYWQLPGDGEEKPVFYADIGGHVYFGITLFLRIGYSNKISEGLPDNIMNTISKNACPIDYPRAMFGFVIQNEKLSFKSRVSVGDFLLVNNKEEQLPVEVILANPKPSFYPGYLLDGKNYEDPDFSLRGYKQYWGKNAVQETAVPEERESVSTSMRSMPEGSEFKGIIRYKNLTEQELGLLLWSLKLDVGCFQFIGNASPYGYGRMKLRIECLREPNYSALYGESGAQLFWDEKDKVELSKYINDCIKAYDEYAVGMLWKNGKRKSIREDDRIKDFFYMKKTIRESSDKEYSYMNLDEYRNLTEGLPTVKAIREEEDSKRVQEEAESRHESMSMDDKLKMLQARFSKNR